MIHSQYRIKMRVQPSSEESVGAIRTERHNSLLVGLHHSRFDNRLFLLTDKSFVTGMRIECQHSDTRFANQEVVLQRFIQRCELTQNTLFAYHLRHFGYWRMVAHERHFHLLAHHHHKAVRLTFCAKNGCQILRMACELKLIGLNILFVNRCRHQSIHKSRFQVFARALQTRKSSLSCISR